MTETTTGPEVIVVAEDAVYDALRGSGANWNVQHRVQTVSQMWDDLGNGRLSQTSSMIVFSDRFNATPGELEAAIATMAPHAATFVVAWNPADAEGLLGRIAEAAQRNSVPAAPVYLLDGTRAGDLLGGLREVLTQPAFAGLVTFPQQWAIDPTQPLDAAPAEAAQFTASVPPVPEAPHAAQATPERYQQHVGTNDPLSRPRRPGQRTFAVTSSKGGSGKSTTAIMLASQIAQSSIKAYEAGLIEKPLKVVLVDMDTRDGQVGSLISKYVPTALNIRVAPTWDEETVLSNLVHDSRLGIDALLAPVRPRTADDVGPDFYRHVIGVLQRTHDVVIMDTSVNYLDPLISTVCLPIADAILFVTTLATTSVQGMARALREITEPAESGGMGINRNKIGIVVNQSVTDVGMDRDSVLQAALRVQIVGAIPLATKDVLTATNYQRMYLLLTHPTLGPAYHKLAQACLKEVSLPSLIEGAPVAPPASTAATSAPAADPGQGSKPRGGLLRRKG